MASRIAGRPQPFLTLSSRDFDDLVALIDGREELPGEAAEAPEALRDYVAGELEELSRHPTFESGVEGALAAGPEALERLELVVRPRITEIIASRLAQGGLDLAGIGEAESTNSLLRHRLPESPNRH